MMEKRFGVRAVKQAGFTLIELIIVIVIIGILAAVAIPQYTNLTADAQTASTQGVAGNLASASATNFAIRSGASTRGSAVANCTDVGGLLQTGLPTGYTIASGAVAAGGSATCTVSGGGTATATFVALGIS